MKALKKLFNMPYPRLVHVDEFKNVGTLAKITVNGEEKWVPARALGYPTTRNRFKMAFWVFVGKYDALKWEQQ